MLFAVYVDELIFRLKSANIGGKLLENYYGCLLYADDISLLAHTLNGMQCMLNICTDFGTEYNAKFNENKSVALRIGPRFNSVCKPFVLGSRCLQFVDSVKYLGVCIVASHRFKCSFEDYKLKFVFVYLTAFLLRVKQPVQKLYRCTYSSRIVYPI